MREWLAIRPIEYHQLEAFGSGAMKCFATKGQLEFYYNYVLKQRADEDTDALRMGRAFHAAMEDPNNWRDRYSLIPTAIDDDRYVPEINDMLDQQQSDSRRLVIGHKINTHLPSHRQYLQCHRTAADLAGKDFMTAEDAIKVAGQVAAVYDNPACRDLLAEKRAFNCEATCILHHDSGVDLKALCDLTLCESIADFKTTRMRNPNDFIRDAIKIGGRGYDWQAGHYSLVTGKSQFFFVSVTNDPPYEANVFEVPRRIVAARRGDIERHCYQLALLLKDKISDVDSQGIPLSFHSEMWGTVIPMELDTYRGNHG